MRETLTEPAAHIGGGDREGDEQQHGRQREAAPCGDSAGPARAREADRKADLAAGGARKKLAKTDEIGVGGIVEPAPALDEFAAKVPKVSDGAAERRQAKLQESREYLEGVARAVPGGERGGPND
ncbi:hypothetical protein Busp01_56230 [Trinickia caryophylli]|nr:hypothetical protein Busp01_56230 [Trinickia caryophylli]